MKNWKIEVYGKVQGVNFRAMTREFFREAGLVGEVRNRDDGSVEILVECGEEEMKKLVDWVGGNPGASRVDRVEISEVEE